MQVTHFDKKGWYDGWVAVASWGGKNNDKKSNDE
jgi:hypothetical protein